MSCLQIKIYSFGWDYNFACISFKKMIFFLQILETNNYYNNSLIQKFKKNPQQPRNTSASKQQKNETYHCEHINIPQRQMTAKRWQEFMAMVGKKHCYQRSDDLELRPML